MNLCTPCFQTTEDVCNDCVILFQTELRMCAMTASCFVSPLDTFIESVLHHVIHHGLFCTKNNTAKDLTIDIRI